MKSIIPYLSPVRYIAKFSINSKNSSNQNIDLKKSIPHQYKDLNPFQLQIHFVESESLFPEEKQNREAIILDFIQSERQKLSQNLKPSSKEGFSLCFLIKQFVIMLYS